MKNSLPHILAILSVLLAARFSAAAQTYTAEPLPFAQALPSKEITSLHQDREGMIWVGTTFGVARYDGQETTVFKSDYSTPDRLTHNYVSPMADSRNYVFIGTQNGLNVFDKATWQLSPVREGPFAGVEIRHLHVDKKEQVWIAVGRSLYRCGGQLDIRSRYDLPSGVTSIYEDSQNRVWAMTWCAGLFLWDAAHDRLSGCPPVGEMNNPFVMYEDRQGRYWLGTWGDGLFRFYPGRGGEAAYEKQSVEGNIYFDITQDDRDGRLWMLSYDALHIFDCGADGRLVPAAFSPSFDHNRMFSTILKDHEGNLWLGAFDAGYYLAFNPYPIRDYTFPFIKEQLGFDANLNCMHEDGEGILWFNQERHGLSLYDMASGTYNLVPLGGHTDLEVNFIVPSRHRNSAWMASSFLPTVFRAERKGMQLRLSAAVPIASSGSETGHVTGILEDRAGNLWVMAEKGLYLYDKQLDFIGKNPAGLAHVCCIAEDGEGDVWLGTTSGDLYRVSPSAGRINVAARYRLPVSFSSSDRLAHLCPDASGHLWMATALGGIYRFDPARRQMADQTHRLLPDLVPVLNLLSQTDRLWIVTPQAAICYDPQTHGRTVYATSDKHIPVHTFRNSAACIGKEGTLYAGGHGGIIAIKNTDTLQPAPAGNVRITDIHLNGKSLLAHPDSTCTVDGQSITLPSTATRLAFTLSSCTYSQHPRTRFAYQLEGMDTSPVILESGQHTAVFDRLPEGTYTLNVWQTDEGGQAVGPVSTYTVTKQPAWYETWAARLAYVLAGLLAAWLAAYTFARRLKKKNARLLREELTRAKVEYFTNVSHELLTPLTILSCLADEMEQEGSAQERNDRTRVLRDNTDRLKKLIKQVLDFRKMEKKNLALQAGYGDVAAFVRRIGQADFALLAQKKALRLDIDIQPAEIYGFYDADKLEEILFNLLSNAIKYTPAHRAVGIKAWTDGQEDGKMLRLQVWDEGIGIAPAEQEKVFNRFYRAPQTAGTESNGIGLSLTRELAALHHGTLTLESQPGQGSRFTLSIPLSETAYSQEELPASSAATPQEEAGKKQDTPTTLPTLLVVDDNVEITSSLARLLGTRYRMLPAHSAAQARPMLSEQDIDLLVCDLRMPGMDGLTFCRTLKADLSTSHIPVIILTAQDSDATRTACYEAGADGYIAKPFETAVLVARIDNLLHLYARHRRMFLRNPETDTAALPYHDRDKEFLHKMTQTVEAHLQDSGFNLEVLSSEAGLSKSTMNRKIKAMTGLTPMDFVKGVRIRAAARLLRDTRMNVSEVAYAVGFDDPKYFAKCFKEACGRTPSQFQQDTTKTKAGAADSSK